MKKERVKKKIFLMIQEGCPLKGKGFRGPSEALKACPRDFWGPFYKKSQDPIFNSTRYGSQ